MEIEELFAAKEIFFERIGIKEDQSRKRKLVYARAAFANAFRREAGPTSMGRILGRDHASIIHYRKLHDENMAYRDYKQLYDKAVAYALEVSNQDITFKMDSSDLLRLIKELREEIRLLKEDNDKLYIYKEKFFKLKELI